MTNILVIETIKADHLIMKIGISKLFTIVIKRLKVYS